MNTGRFVSKNASSVKRRIFIENSQIVFRHSKEKFDGVLLRHLLWFSNQVISDRSLSGMPVRIIFSKKISFSDKLMYILFECICYQLIQSGHMVYVQMEISYDIITHGCTSSPLLLLSTGKNSHVEKFRQKFSKDLYKQHFREIYPNDSKIDELSILMDDIAIFQKPFAVKEDQREKIAEVLVELVGNAVEHTDGDCLIDFDITNEYSKRGESSKSYRGINIAILNFSGELLGSSLEKKITNSERLGPRYQLVQKAYDTHSAYFDEGYVSEDFFNIATFQHKISGRPGDSLTGGTGLTKLIQSLEEDSDAYRCYVISGSRLLRFNQEYMGYNEDHWIGFNDANDFLGAPPRKELLDRNPFLIPGTAYNLNFVMEVT